MANRVFDNGANNDNDASLDSRHYQSSSHHAPRKHPHYPTSNDTYPSIPKENYQNFRDQQPQQHQPYKATSNNNKRHWQDTNHVSSVKTPKAHRKRAATRPPAIKPVTAFELLQNARCQETNDDGLYLIPPGSPHREDNKAWLKLGLGLTELAGEAGSGKSQMAMSLCVQAVMKNLQTNAAIQGPPTNGNPPTTTFAYRAIYISLAGGQASLSRIAYRMQQMADAQQPPQQQPQNPLGPQVLSQILTHSVRNHEDLFTLLREDLPLCLQQGHHQQPAAAVFSSPQAQETSATNNEPPVAVVVLDSIADLFRLGNSDGAEDKAAILKRSYLLFELSALLRELSDRYKVPILVVNQVSCDFASNSNLPALGLSWANCINASYVIRRPQNQIIAGTNSFDKGETHAAASSSRTVVAHSGLRHIFLAKSATHPVDKMASFVIDTNGVHGIPINRE